MFKSAIIVQKLLGSLCCLFAASTFTFCSCLQLLSLKQFVTNWKSVHSDGK